MLTAFARGVEGTGEGLSGVMDPVGGDDDLYEEVCRQLEELVEAALLRLEPVIRP